MNEQPLSLRDVEALRVTVHALDATLTKLDGTVEKFRESVDATYVRKDVLEPKLAGMQRQIDQHHDWGKWALRLVVGAVILAGLGLILATTK